MSDNLTTKHRQLYDKIPSFKCKPGCNDCCGPIPISFHEAAQIPDGGAKIEAHYEQILKAKDLSSACMTCPHSTILGCAIYETRPLMCRLFGTVDDEKLHCPHGCRPEKMLTAAEGRIITAAYRKLFSVKK